ncbi:MAG TPA: hypothetical protein VF062_14645 [Candidatus Limnocylindrales bacterium]
MDFYILGGTGSAGILVEEFTRHDDSSASGRHNAVWFAHSSSSWSSSAGFSRAVRTDPDLRATVIPATRAGAAHAFARLGGGALPPDPEIRTHFLDYEPFPSAAPLRLTPGSDQKRLYRVLFANGPSSPFEPSGGDGHLHWQLHRVANGAAWALDVTVITPLADAGFAGSLDRLIAGARLRHGLIPVTIDRFF